MPVIKGKFDREALRTSLAGTAAKTAVRLFPKAVGKLTGDLPLSTLAMGQFLQQSGKPLKFNFSQRQWDYLINTAKDENRWTPSTNPKYPGWEYTDEVQVHYRPDDKELMDLHNILGVTTIRRKPTDNGGFEYMVADENFDFVRSNTGETPYSGIRQVHPLLFKALSKYDPNMFKRYVDDEYNLFPDTEGKETMLITPGDKGKSFNIKASTKR